MRGKIINKKIARRGVSMSTYYKTIKSNLNGIQTRTTKLTGINKITVTAMGEGT